MKKIVFVTQNTAPFRMKWLNHLADDYQITVYQLGDYDKSVNKKYISDNETIFEVKTDYRSFFGNKLFNIRSILSERYDILLLDGYGFIAQVILIFALIILGKSYYLSVDGGFIPAKENVFKKWIKSKCLGSAKGIFSTSEDTDNFIRYYAKSKPRIFRHYFSSIDSSYICTESEKLLGRERKKELGLDDKFVAISVGRFIPVKGFDVLLKAAHYVDDDVCIVIVGGTPTSAYNDLLKDLPEGKVRFVDFLGKDELRDYFLLSDAYLCASRGDVWGLTIGEAMACGLPIISSDKCLAARAMVAHNINGFLIADNEDPGEYALHINEIKKSPVMQETFKNNNLRAAAKYAIDAAVETDKENINLILGEKNK